jgi:hypothetical protein
MPKAEKFEGFRKRLEFIVAVDRALISESE